MVVSARGTIRRSSGRRIARPKCSSFCTIGGRDTLTSSRSSGGGAPFAPFPSFFEVGPVLLSDDRRAMRFLLVRFFPKDGPQERGKQIHLLPPERARIL